MADATSVSPESMDDEFEKGLSNAGLSGENKDFAASFLMSAAGGAIDPKMVKEAYTFYDKQAKKLGNDKSVRSKDYLDRQTKLYDDLQKTQDRPMSGGEIIARAVIGLAPTLVGAAIGGMSDIGMGLGGSAGGTASLGGLKQLDDSLEKNKEAEKATIKGKIDAAKKLSEEELKNIGEMERDVNKKMLELPVQGLRGAFALKLKEAAAKAKNEKDLPSSKYLAAGYARRLEQAESVFDGLQKKGYSRASRMQNVRSWFPGETQPDQLRQNEQAENNFTNAVLRRESGAAITDTERTEAIRQYFPRPGDNEETIAQKKANRQQVMAALKAEAGRALNEVPLVKTEIPSEDKTKKDEQSAARQKRIQELRKKLGK